MTSDEPTGLTPARELPVDEAMALLEHGELGVEGRLVVASNATLYCSVCLNGVTAACVYKPVAGERPLWDFPDGTLAEREVAAYEVSAATGWLIVPPTVFRSGPLGPGMVQLWIDTDEDVDIRRLIRGTSSDQLRRIAVFDAVGQDGYLLLFQRDRDHPNAVDRLQVKRAFPRYANGPGDESTRAVKEVELAGHNAIQPIRRGCASQRT